MSDISTKILRIIEKSKSPVSLNMIMKQARLERRQAKRLLKELERRGEIFRHKSGKYAAAGNEKTINGKLDVHPDGFGFLAPDEGGDDIFIPARKMNGAVHGDRVAIRPEKYKGKKEGRVMTILKRSMTTVVARIERVRGYILAVPFEKRFNYDIIISPKQTFGAEEDDVVEVEILVYPDKNRNPEGKVVRRIGKLGEKGIDNEIVMAKYDLPREFPGRVEKEVADNAAKMVRNKGKRTDLTELYTVTIDGETARDFDDAVSIEKTAQGYTLWVHIADVSHFVRPGSQLDKEAFRRGTSCYFPEFAIPMLPEKLSNDLCSLRPRTKRMTMSARMEFDKQGRRKSSKFFRSVIQSNKRLTYTYVKGVLDGEEKPRDKRLKDLISISAELAGIIIKRRAREGMLDFDLPEPEFVFNENDEIEDIRPLERHMAHRLIENFMIEANEAVSEFLEQRRDVSLFRVHGNPDERKLEQYVELCRSFGVDVHPIKDVNPGSVRELCDTVNASRYGNILGNMLVRSMAKAEYATNNIGHFGLASASYTHFTSPIRRYPDLVIHRLLASELFGDHWNVDRQSLEGAAEQSSKTEQNAEQAEREIQKFKALEYLEKHNTEPYAAFISRVSNAGLFIFVEKVMIQGLVRMENLSDDYYVLDDSSGSLFGKRTGKRYRVGDNIEVFPERISYDILEADFYLAGE
ncbi:ribonuclease R [Limisalsivibrio acetivorans]|uniref:ribonuclease R n=1 Tax=Limisalsivibrio acetivorans TaxID=1304888 RepID=UPI0003B35D4E|nr:ribonuclease R [Limisalsivibrio acetivorans]